MTERLEISRPSDLPSVEVLLAESSARRWRVLHEAYAVCTGLAIERPCGWTYRRRVHVHGPGGLMLVEPGEVHENTETTASASFRVLWIAPSVVERAAKELGIVPAQPHLRVAQLYDPALFRSFVALHASLEQPGTTLERQSRFATCVRLLLEQCTEAHPKPLAPRADRSVVARARAFIHEHAAGRIGLEELATVAGSLSRFHLVRAFTAAMGVPPHAYQIQLRIARARALLAAGEAPVDVAAELGFADQSHLTRQFRRIAGVTPAVYARATRPSRPTSIVLARPERPAVTRVARVGPARTF